MITLVKTAHYHLARVKLIFKDKQFFSHHAREQQCLCKR